MTLRVRAWDGVVRALHALLAGLVAFDLVWDDGGPLHRQIGYAAAAVVLLRLIWAFYSSGNGRLAALRPSLRATVLYLRDLRSHRVARPAGHDPLGLWMVWLLWTLVLLLAVTGFMSRLDAFWGDDRLHDLHTWLANGLMVAILFHLAGVVCMSILRRDNLPAAMVSGWKRADPDEHQAQDASLESHPPG